MIIQNFNSLRCLVLEISAFQYEACHRIRTGASVHELFVGGVYSIEANDIFLIFSWLQFNIFIWWPLTRWPLGKVAIIFGKRFCD